MHEHDEDPDPRKAPDDVPPTPPDEPKPPPVQDPPSEPVEPPYVVRTPGVDPRTERGGLPRRSSQGEAGRAEGGFPRRAGDHARKDGL